MEDPKTAVVLQLAQKIQGFQIVGACLFWALGCDVEIAEVDQGVGDSSEVPLGSLDLEDFAIALFGVEQIVHQGAGITKVAERIRQRLLIARHSVLSHGCFPGAASLSQITTMKKDSGSMFMTLTHEIVKREAKDRTMSDA